MTEPTVTHTKPEDRYVTNDRTHHRTDHYAHDDRYVTNDRTGAHARA